MKRIIERIYNEPAIVVGVLTAGTSAAGLAFHLDWLIAVSAVIAAVGAVFTRDNVTPLGPPKERQ